MVATQEGQLRVLTEELPPLVKVVLTLFTRDKNTIDAPAQYLLFRQYSETKSGLGWDFPSTYLRFDENVDDALDRLLTDFCHDIVTKKVKLVGLDHHHDAESDACVLSLHYLFVCEGCDSLDLQEGCQWMSLEQIAGLGYFPAYIGHIMSEIQSAVYSFLHKKKETLLLEVDEFDQPIGSISISQAHSDSSVYHRVVHIVLFNSSGEVVLQLRSARNIKFAGWRDVHGGHNEFGQSIEQTAHHEIMEELGIDPPLYFFGKELHEMVDNESEFVYKYYAIHDGFYGINKNEIDAVKAFDCQKLLDGLYDKHHCFLSYINTYLLELQHIWKPLAESSRLSDREFH